MWMKVVVVGAGAVGANIAYRLAAQEQEVTVVDAGRPGRGTTGTSISWLSTFPQAAAADPAELELRLSINDQFAQLAAEIGGTWMHWADTLTWATDPDIRARLETDWKTCAERGVDVEVLSGRQARAREPALAIPDGTEVYAEHGGGWIDAPVLVEHLLAAAARHGANVIEHARVTAVERAAGRVAAVITETGRRLAADVVVNAAGSWASHLGALAGCPVPLDLRPGLVVYSQPLPRGPLTTVLNTPKLNIRPAPGGGVAIHARAESMYGYHSLNAVTPAEVVSAAARWLPGLAGTAPADSRVGIRPVPPRGPLIGPHPALGGFYVAVSHGGIGWGPLWGKLVAAEITGTEAPALARWRPSRFLARPTDMAEEEITCA
jgi:glycine/D-amino acid oxidase-like deaminating enzyme